MNEALGLTRVIFDPSAAKAAGRYLYVCRHVAAPGRSTEEITRSHDQDVMLQAQFGLTWFTYFVDRAKGLSYCLAEAPSKQAVQVCHAAAHGDMPDYELMEVEWDTVLAFLGEIGTPALGQAWHSDPLRTVIAIQAANASALAIKLGDEKARSLLQKALLTAANVVRQRHGSVVKEEPDAILASFTSVVRAVECAAAVQHAVKALALNPADSVSILAGLNTGEPMSDRDNRELFGAAVQIAREACNQAGDGEVLVSSVVRDLCAGKTFRFEPRGTLSIGGDEPIRLFALHMPDGLPDSRPGAYPDGLTQREVDVLKLIAAGKSNLSIANELVISLNTVARHVAHILEKTGTANRTEAAAYAYRERLV